MLNPIDFADCIRDNLKDRNFGKKRADEIIKDFNARAEFHKSTGLDPTSASMLAMKDTFDNLSMQAAERAKRTAKTIEIQVTNMERVKQGLNVTTSMFLMDGKKGSQGVALARAAVSLIEDDPRFSGLSYATNKETTRGQLMALFEGTLDKIGKGAFGMQKGKAHLSNIIRELKGEKTGDIAAQDFAAAWNKIQDVGVDLFNQAGGSMKKLANYIPQGQNAVKIVQAGFERWSQVHMNALDWANMRWPDGTAINPEDRIDVLKAVFDTLTSDGANKIDPTAFRGRGRAVGNALEQHRFLHYKDAKAWEDVHNEFGDGNVFDVFVRHIEDLSHKIALIQTFGPNPETARANLEAIVKKEASKLSAKDRADADAVMKNKFGPMFEQITRDNPMDPHSTMGALVTGTSNILTSAQLGAASLLAIPGDFVQTAAVRALNKMGMFNNMSYYLKTIATDRAFMSDIATQSGFIADEVTQATYAATRFTGTATLGPAVSRHIAEAVMRLSLMSGHTRAARWSVQSEFMGMFRRYKDTPYEQLPWVDVMSRYGITKQDWTDFTSNTTAWQPRKDVNFLRPIDILKSDLPNKQDIYRKFQGMIFEEAKKMVPEATIEGSVMLKDTTRPDTLAGVLLHSFAMYKNFPVSFAMIYGRLGMMAPSVMGSKPMGRLAFFAGLGAGMTGVGAVGLQMREISKGNDPLPMDDPKFMAKALLAGGALSIWGDMLTAGVNQFGTGPQDVVAGPLFSFLGDTTNLVAGDAFKFAESLGSLSDGEFHSDFKAKAVEYARKYTPGSSLWWARLALQRQVFDRLQELADPKTYAKRRRKAQQQKKNFGNEAWWQPGERLPSRAPNLTGD